MSLYTEDEEEEEEKYILRDVGSRGNGANSLGHAPQSAIKSGDKLFRASRICMPNERDERGCNTMTAR